MGFSAATEKILPLTPHHDHLLLGVLIVFNGGSAIAPLIYTLF
jgi:hypothetical protein